jgi:type I restriction enzyme S subunit
LVIRSEVKLIHKQTEIGNIPEDWIVSTLEEISQRVTDGSHFSPKEMHLGKKIIATVKDMRYNGFDFTDSKRISDEDYAKLVRNGCSPKRGDIIISKDGANCLDLIFIYDQNGEIVLLSSIAIVTLKTGYNPYFYRYYLLSPTAQKIMREGFVTGSAIPRVILKNFKKIPVPIPPNLETQSKIANILRNLDLKIDVNVALNKTLEEIGQIIFKRWFVDFEFPNQVGKPYKSSGGEMVTSEIGEIPKEWSVGKYSDLVEMFTGKGLKRENLKENGQYPVLGANGELGRTNEFLFDEELILIGRVGTLGQVFLINGKVWISDNALISKPRAKENHHYAFFVLKSFDMESLNRGSTQPLVTQTDLKNQAVILPDKNTLIEFERIVGSFYNKIEKNNLQNNCLLQIRDMLLPKLMSGKIRVRIDGKMENQ